MEGQAGGVATALEPSKAPIRGMGVRLALLPLYAAMVQRSRHRALNPESGVRLPVAVLLDAR